MGSLLCHWQRSSAVAELAGEIACIEKKLASSRCAVSQQLASHRSPVKATNHCRRPFPFALFAPLRETPPALQLPKLKAAYHPKRLPAPVLKTKSPTPPVVEKWSSANVPASYQFFMYWEGALQFPLNYSRAPDLSRRQYHPGIDRQTPEGGLPGVVSVARLHDGFY